MNLNTRRSFLRAASALSFGVLSPRKLKAELLSSRNGFFETALEATAAWVPLGNSMVRLLTYNQRTFAPILELQPGDHVRLQLINRLDEPTNLHFHGLHLPPTGTADNVMRQAAAGETLSYEFVLPQNQPGGTYWYHPHIHGLTARQVASGLAGLIVVRGELDEFPEIRSAREEFLVLQDFDPQSDATLREPGPMERIRGREGPVLTVNGVVQPRFTVQKGGWLRLHILNASSSRFYRLRLEDHPLQMIATDGGPLAAPVALDELLLTPGERTEVMVLAARAGGSFRLLNLPHDRGNRGMQSTAGSPLTLASLDYEGQAGSPASLPNRLSSIQSLPSPVAPAREFYLGMGMMMMGRGMNFTINGRAFNSNRIDTVARLDSVEDWDFINLTTMDHPMHVHTNSFQVVPADNYAVPAWKDVVLVPARSRVRIRSQFRDYSGVSLYHCHILDHEDLGMMGTLLLGS